MKTVKHPPIAEKKRREQTPLKERSDEELLAYYRQYHDRDVLGILFNRYAHKVLGTCIKYLKNPVDGQDAAADIFEKLCNRLDELEIDSFAPWLHTVTRNHCIKVLERQLRPHLEALSEIHPNHFMENGAFADHNKEERLEQLSAAIDRLNDDQRRCIVLFFLKQYTYKEIAAQTTYDFNQVKSHIQNGKRNLKIALSARS